MQCGKNRTLLDFFSRAACILLKISVISGHGQFYYIFARLTQKCPRRKDWSLANATQI